MPQFDLVSLGIDDAGELAILRFVHPVEDLASLFLENFDNAVKSLQAWYKRHLGIDAQAMQGGWSRRAPLPWRRRKTRLCMVVTSAFRVDGGMAQRHSLGDFDRRAMRCLMRRCSSRSRSFNVRRISARSAVSRTATRCSSVLTSRVVCDNA